MLSYIIGRCEASKTGELIVECSGIGFQCACSARALSALAGAAQAKVYTYLSMTENGLNFYGFMDENEREMFFRLTSVNKVGPKVALGILSRYSPQQLTSLIAAGDAKMLSAAPGIGKKLAEAIIFALKGAFEPDGQSGFEAFFGESAEFPPGDARSDAVAALESLGFEYAQSVKKVKAVYTEGMEAEALIRAALQAQA